MLITSLVSAYSMVLSQAWATHHHHHGRRRDPCKDVICPPGHECSVSENGLGQCSCKETCEFHISLVCGSNNVTYDNECFLYRDSCLTGLYVEASHPGPCPLFDVPSQIKNRPVVCFQRERDILRNHLVHILKYRNLKRSTKLKSYKRVVKVRFNICDTDRNGQISSQEFLECFRNDVTRPVRTDENGDLVLTLCLDAILNEGDRDLDMELSLAEFKHLMRPNFKTVIQRCSLEGKYYDDGAETSDNCSFCVCASGNWVCTRELSCHSESQILSDNSEEHQPSSRTINDKEDEDDSWTLGEEQTQSEEYDENV